MTPVISNKSWYRSLSKRESRNELIEGVRLPFIAKLILLAVASISFACPTLRAQNSAPQKATSLAFDAVSVRPSDKKFYLKFDFLDPTRQPAPGGLFSWNVQLNTLIVFAYDLKFTKTTRDALVTLPKWTNENWYAIEARAEGNPTRNDVREMVRAMLEDRFQFTAHMEKRDGEVFALTVAKQSQGLKPHPEGAACDLPASITDENKYPHAYPKYAAYKPHCGIFNRELSHVGERRFEMLDVTMQQVADSLQQPIPVIDQTGLKGHYDAVLDFGYGVSSPNADTSDEIGLPILPVALEKQLGLKLVKQNAQVNVFVVDHIGTLSEN